jgi:citrate lyase beta subunit
VLKPVDAPIRRSALITPGSRPERIARAAAAPCDSVVIDLEDGVAPQAKASARAAAARALASLDFGGRERALRVNAPGTAELEADLGTLDPSHVDCLWLPKVERAEQVERVAAALPPGLPLVLSIETPAGLFQAAAIAGAGAAASPRSALFFGSGDYCMETGARPGEEGLRVPRGLVVAAAAMHGLQAVDAAYFLDPKDPVATEADARHAREMGFDGKLVFHPAQIEPANRVFAPAPEEVARAARLVAAFEAAQARGEGVAVADGAFLAVDTVQPLRRVLWMAQRLGIPASEARR